MTRNIPHDKLFKEANVIDKWQSIILSIASIFTIASIILNALKKDYCFLGGAVCIDIVDCLVSVFSVAYIIFEIWVSSKLYNAEKARRTDLIDNSFITNFAGEQSTGYYNSGGINPGVYKLAVNGFENSLFSSNTAKKMLKKKWIIAVLILVVFLISAFLGEKFILNSLVQIAAAGVLVQHAVKLQLFSDRINKIHEDYKSLFSNLRDETDKTKRAGEMIKNVLAYETTISSAVIALDSKIFFKDNDELSNKWDQMKKDYKIEYVDN